MRLIDADALYEEANKTALECNGCVDTLIGMDYVRCMVKRMPTVDPVKHAHWVRTNEMRNKHLYYLKCSACDYKSEDPLYYCGFCGAHMNEGM